MSERPRGARERGAEVVLAALQLLVQQAGGVGELVGEAAGGAGERLEPRGAGGRLGVDAQTGGGEVAVDLLLGAAAALLDRPLDRERLALGCAHDRLDVHADVTGAEPGGRW